MTTFRIGGPADWLVRPRTTDEVALALHVCRTEGIPLRSVGMGSNLLVADEGVPGAVLQTRAMPWIQFDGTSVTCGAGVTNARLVGATRGRGLAGLECLVGYPGTLGGAVRMNAGGAAGYLGPRVEWVKGVAPSGRVEYRTGRQCRFRYRGSDLGDLVVTEVRLRLDGGVDPEEYALRCRTVFEAKRRTQPLREHSAGCVWRNPSPETSAGALLERAGCKGMRVGAAEVSPVHANFVVNRGGARCADVLALMDESHRRVLGETGVDLRPEVILWGDAPVAVSSR